MKWAAKVNLLFSLAT